MKRFKKILKIVGLSLAGLLCFLLILAGSAFTYFYFHDQTLAKTPATWGLTFSITQSTSLGLDWKANYLAILTDLHPQGIRLIASWDTIEPTNGTWDYSDLDWEVSEAAQYHVPVIIAIGQKVPRWPECHIPTWASSNTTTRDQELLAYETATVKRYKDNSNLLYWQVENEPYIAFGTCQEKDLSAVADEVSLVHSLDSTHPIMITDGGEWGLWYKAASKADVFGTTMYRYVYNGHLGISEKYLLPPEYYQAKAALVRLITGKPQLKVIVSELGTEPWSKQQISQMNLQQQEASLPLSHMKETLSYAQQTGFDTYYLWGSEWWYYAKVHGDPSYWNEIKQVMATGKI